MLMRRYRFVVALSGCAVAIALLGARSTCDRRENPSSPAYSPTADALRVQIATERSTYKVGEPIMVTVTLRNVGQQAFWTSKTIGFAHMAGAFDLEVVD